MAASLFYSIIRNFGYFRPKGCCCFYPVSCVFLLHMGLLITTYANLVNVWKTSGEAGKQRVNGGIPHCCLISVRLRDWGSFLADDIFNSTSL